MIRLFHSYQYIPNSKEIYFDKTQKQLKNNDGHFLLGLLQIPDIPNHDLIVEKYLVSKRQSKKVNYRNHTKHNMKIFISCREVDIEEFISKIIDKSSDMFYKNSQLKYLFKLLKKNYIQFSLDQNIFDIICLNPYRKNPFIENYNRKITLTSDKTISIGNYLFDLSNESYNLNKLNFQDDNIVQNLNVNGGILYLKLNNSGKKDILNMLNKIDKTKSPFYFIFDDLFELNIWKHYINIIFGGIDKTDHIEMDNGYFCLKLGNKPSIKNESYNILLLTKKQPIEDCNLNKIIDNIKKNFVASIESFWIIQDSSKQITLEFITHFIKVFNSKFDNSVIFPTTKNIYQLSKIIIPLNSCQNNCENTKIEKIYIDRKMTNLLKTNKLNYTDIKHNFDETMCSICLQSNVSLVKTECNHYFCVSCYLNYLNIKIKENTEIGCAVCRQNLSNKQLYLENLTIFKNIENVIKTNIDKSFIYLSDENETSLESNNLSNILNYFVTKNNGKFTFIKKIDDLFKIGVKVKNNDDIVLCYKTHNFEKIFSIGFSHIINIIEN